MNEYKVLIYHYSSKNEKWYDATNNVVWYTDDGNSWKVRFANSDQYFHVSFSNMKIFENPEKVKSLINRAPAPVVEEKPAEEAKAE